MKNFLHGVLWILAVLVYIPCAVWVIGTGLELTAGTDSIRQRFASGEPVRVDLGRYSSARSVFVRADSPGVPQCVVNGPGTTLEQRTGRDLTVAGTTWRRIYTVDSHRNADAESTVTCRAGKGAEFALGRDRLWDSVLLFILSLVAAILLMTGTRSLYERWRKATDPEYAAAKGEQEGAGAE